MKKLKGFVVIPKKATIQVTRKNIDTGDFGDSTSCAIAKAVKARMGDHPEVDNYGIDVTLPCGVSAHYSIPKKAQNFINAFDAIEGADYDVPLSEAKAHLLKLRRKLKPFTFTATLDNAQYN